MFNLPNERHLQKQQPSANETRNRIQVSLINRETTESPLVKHVEILLQEYDISLFIHKKKRERERERELSKHE